MKKTIIIAMAAAMLQFTTNAKITKVDRSKTVVLPEAVSNDPYKGQGTREEYVTLAQKYEAESYNLAAQAMQSVKNAKDAQYRAMTATDMSRRLEYKARSLNHIAKAKEYNAKAKQAVAEQNKYLELSRMVNK